MNNFPKTLTVEKYMQGVLAVVEINAKLEELKRVAMYAPNKEFIAQREQTLQDEKYLIMKKLDNKAKPLELAPLEQYIDVIWEQELQE
jgi:hypothetical protein